MRPSRKRKLFIWGVVALLLLALAGYLEYRFNFRASIYPAPTADPYVPCPPGTHPQPEQRHICEPN